jgi:hypothetical protein
LPCGETPVHADRLRLYPEFRRRTIYLDLNNGNGEGENFTDADLHADTTKIGQWQKVTGTFRTAPGTTGVKIRVLLVYAPVEGAPALKNKIRRRRACYA